MPQFASAQSLFETVAGVGGIGLCFGVACAMARRHLERWRQPIPATGAGRADRTDQRSTSRAPARPGQAAANRRPFRMPRVPGLPPVPARDQPVVAVAPVPRTSRVDRLDLPFPPGTSFAPAYLYDRVSREYIDSTRSMPRVVDLPRRSSGRGRNGGECG